MSNPSIRSIKQQCRAQGQGDTGDSNSSRAIAAGMVWVHAEARKIRSGNTRGRNLNYEALADGRTDRGLGEEVPSTRGRRRLCCVGISKYISPSFYRVSGQSVAQGTEWRA